MFQEAYEALSSQAEVLSSLLLFLLLATTTLFLFLRRRWRWRHGPLQSTSHDITISAFSTPHKDGSLGTSDGGQHTSRPRLTLTELAERVLPFHAVLDGDLSFRGNVTCPSPSDDATDHPSSLEISLDQQTPCKPSHGASMSPIVSVHSYQSQPPDSPYTPLPSRTYAEVLSLLLSNPETALACFRDPTTIRYPSTDGRQRWQTWRHAIRTLYADWQHCHGGASGLGALYETSLSSQRLSQYEDEFWLSLFGLSHSFCHETKNLSRCLRHRTGEAVGRPLLIMHSGPLYLQSQYVTTMPDALHRHIPTHTTVCYAYSGPSFTRLPGVQCLTFHALPLYPTFATILSGPLHFCSRLSLPLLFRHFAACALPDAALIFQAYVGDPLGKWSPGETAQYQSLSSELLGLENQLTFSLADYLTCCSTAGWRVTGVQSPVPTVFDHPETMVHRWTEGEGVWMRRRYGPERWAKWLLYVSWTSSLLRRRLLQPFELCAIKQACD